MTTEQQSIVPRTSEQRYAEAKQLELEKIERERQDGSWYVANGPRKCLTCATREHGSSRYAKCTNPAVNLKNRWCHNARTDDGLCGPEGAFYVGQPPAPVKARGGYRWRVQDTFWVVLVCGVWFGVFLLMGRM